MYDILDKFGTPSSVYPPTKYLTFGPWIYLVPQFKPESVLILGYAGGTAAGLIKLLYGDVPITGVDIEECPNWYGATLIQADAQEYIKTCASFDVVIIDLFPADSFFVCDFIITKEFIYHLSRIANYIIVNTVNNPDLGIYFTTFKHIGTTTPAKLGNKIFHFANKEIPDLRILIK